MLDGGRKVSGAWWAYEKDVSWSWSADGCAKAERNRKNLEEILWKTQRRAFLASSM